MSERFVVGDTVTLTNTFAVSGTATDPTTISLVVTDPTGTATTYTYAGATITKSSTGVYTKNITASTAGRWSYRWIGTGTAADVESDVFDVAPLDPSAASPFATEAELEAYTGTSVATDRARLLLDMASGAIRAYTNQTISQATTTAVMPGNHSEKLVLPERPVTSVTSVTIGATSLAADTDYVWDGAHTLYRGSRVDGVLSVNGPDYLINGWGDWGGPGAQVTVVYTHGFAVIPNDVKGVCLALAARSLQSPDGVNSETVGSYSVSYSRTGGAVSLLDEERRLLDRYRRKVF